MARSDVIGLPPHVVNEAAGEAFHLEAVANRPRLLSIVHLPLASKERAARERVGEPQVASTSPCIITVGFIAPPWVRWV
jgi:hypothetical protein